MKTSVSSALCTTMDSITGVKSPNLLEMDEPELNAHSVGFVGLTRVFLEFSGLLKKNKSFWLSYASMVSMHG
jgi:hypothetical protein